MSDKFYTPVGYGLTSKYKDWDAAEDILCKMADDLLLNLRKERKDSKLKKKKKNV